MFRMLMHQFKKYFYFLAQQNKGALVDAMLESTQEAQRKQWVEKRTYAVRWVDLGEAGKV